MADNIVRSKGRGQSYKFDRAGTPAEFGPFIGVVKNNIDPTRSGRLQVYIEQLAGDDPDDQSLWRTVAYIPPFYGVTPKNNASGSAGSGSYKGNQQSYGMWFTPPDIGVQVICFFVAGDPNQGYYMGVVPDPGITHMIPAIGATRQYETKNSQQETEISTADAKQMPVVEINIENPALDANPRFFDAPKPIHDYVYTILLNQGLLGDYLRGPITSSAQRESPSSAYGIVTPGRPIYQGGLSESDVQAKLDSGAVTLADIQVEGRRGGHSIVMDDGDLQGRDQLMRLRTAKGHQITMSDDGDCFYFIHANGQTWIELGTEGTVDVFTTNSMNVRSQGEINFHADKNININAGENFFIRAKNMRVETQESFRVSAAKDITAYAQEKIAIKSDGALTLDSKTAGWLASGAMKLKGSRIDLNGPAPESVEALKPLVEYTLDDTKFQNGKGWIVEQGKLVTIVPRAPTHEPWPYHNKGVPVQVDLAASQSATPSAGVQKALDGASNTTATAPINTAAVLKTPAASTSVGSLNKQQITGLLASAQVSVNQPSNVVSVDKGIGKYGFNPAQLESSGYLKPGTVSQLAGIQAPAPTAEDEKEAARLGNNVTPEIVARQRQVNKVLASPTVWTGQGGVNSLGGLLNDAKLQDRVQQGLMSSSLTGLQNSGLAKGTESIGVLGPLVQSATKFGVGSVNSLVKGTASPDLTSALNNTIKNSSYATSFITSKLGDFSALTRRAVAAVSTVNRQIVDTALTAALGDAKIPSPIFKPLARPEFTPSEFADIREKFETEANTTSDLIEETRIQLDDLYADALALQAQDSISAASVSNLESRLNSIRTNFNSQANAKVSTLKGLRDSAPEEVKTEFESRYEGIVRLVEILKGFVAAIRDIITDLRDRQT